MYLCIFCINRINLSYGNIYRNIDFFFIKVLYFFTIFNIQRYVNLVFGKRYVYLMIRLAHLHNENVRYPFNKYQ